MALDHVVKSSSNSKRGSNFSADCIAKQMSLARWNSKNKPKRNAAQKVQQRSAERKNDSIQFATGPLVAAISIAAPTKPTTQLGVVLMESAWGRRALCVVPSTQ